MATTDIMRTILDKAKDPYLKTCKYKFCKKEFRATRLNQEYCCLACKGKANNLIAKNKRDISKKINTILLKNREILHNYYSKGSINVTFVVKPKHDLLATVVTRGGGSVTIRG